MLPPVGWLVSLAGVIGSALASVTGVLLSAGACLSHSAGAVCLLSSRGVCLSRVIPPNFLRAVSFVALPVHPSVSPRPTRVPRVQLCVSVQFPFLAKGSHNPPPTFSTVLPARFPLPPPKKTSVLFVVTPPAGSPPPPALPRPAPGFKRRAGGAQEAPEGTEQKGRHERAERAAALSANTTHTPPVLHSRLPSACVLSGGLERRLPLPLSLPPPFILTPPFLRLSKLLSCLYSTPPVVVFCCTFTHQPLSLFSLLGQSISQSLFHPTAGLRIFALPPCFTLPSLCVKSAVSEAQGLLSSLQDV
jgi:hypothetical protein